MTEGYVSNALFDALKSKPALHPERRSLPVMLRGSALVAYGRFDRRIDADVIPSGLRGDRARIPPHLPIPLQFARAGRASSGRPICGDRPGIGLGTLGASPPTRFPPPPR